MDPALNSHHSFSHGALIDISLTNIITKCIPPEKSFTHHTKLKTHHLITAVIAWDSNCCPHIDIFRYDSQEMSLNCAVNSIQMCFHICISFAHMYFVTEQYVFVPVSVIVIRYLLTRLFHASEQWFVLAKQILFARDWTIPDASTLCHKNITTIVDTICACPWPRCRLLRFIHGVT